MKTTMKRSEPVAVVSRGHDAQPSADYAESPGEPVCRATGIPGERGLSLPRTDDHSAEPNTALIRLVTREGPPRPSTIVDKLHREVQRLRAQQTAIAELGQAALTGIELDLLVGQACALVCEVMGIECCRIVELSPDGRTSRIRGSVGLAESAGQRLNAEDGALEIYTLLSGEPVIFPDLLQETRFAVPDFVLANALKSGVGLVVPERGTNFGILSIYSAEKREFEIDEIEFLRLVANILGEASEGCKSQEAIVLSEKRFRSLVENSSEGLALTDRNSKIVYVGPSTARILGYPDAEIVGKDFPTLIHPDDLGSVRELWETLLEHPGPGVRAEFRFRHRDGHWLWLESVNTNLLDEPSVRAVVINYRDGSDRKKTEALTQHQALHDNLTGVANRLLFRNRLSDTLLQTRRSHHRGFAVIYLDIDRFKVINDTLGHACGDRLLQQVATRMRTCLRIDDVIARLGGDEFTILLVDIDPEQVVGVARKIFETFSSPFHLDEHVLHVTASMGVSTFPDDGDDVDTLIKNADQAMYRAKELGRNTIEFFTPSLRERCETRLSLELSLRQAIERNEFELQYQPVYDCASSQVGSVEALIRWRHPERGLVPPSEFIPIAEETRMILPIGEWVLRTACRQLRAWHAAGVPELCIAVNVSAHQLAQPNFVPLIEQLLRDCELEPRFVELEITESSVMQNLASTLIVLRQLKTLGFRIAVDDFGTGLSSLIYLKQFPIDTLKIDRGFLTDVTHRTEAAIVTAIITLAHSLGLRTVAEGVETKEQFEFLREHGCDAMQGFLFSKSLSPRDLSATLFGPDKRWLEARAY